MAVLADAVTLAEVAEALAAPGKGLLASDESVGTIGKRLEKTGLTNDEVRAGRFLMRPVTSTAAAGVTGP